MTTIILLILFTLLSIVYNKGIKKHATKLYWGALILCCICYGLGAAGYVRELPMAFRAYFFGPIKNGIVPTVLFIIVMFAGALQDNSLFRRKIMPIRAELSIIASIFTVGHFFLCLRHFLRLFTPELFTSSLLHTASMLVGLYAIVIMIPLWITSYHSIRKKMSRASWVNLQNFAYLVYGFTYIHIMLLDLPKAFPALRDTISTRPTMPLEFYYSGSFINILTYSAIFWGYTFLRVHKYFNSKKVDKSLKMPEPSFV